MQSYTRTAPFRPIKSIPATPHDGPHPDELRARRVLSRVSISDALAREMASLAFGIPEKSERRGA